MKKSNNIIKSSQLDIWNDMTISKNKTGRNKLYWVVRLPCNILTAAFIRQQLKKMEKKGSCSYLKKEEVKTPHRFLLLSTVCLLFYIFQILPTALQQGSLYICLHIYRHIYTILHTKNPISFHFFLRSRKCHIVQWWIDRKCHIVQWWMNRKCHTVRWWIDRTCPINQW